MTEKELISASDAVLTAAAQKGDKAAQSVLLDRYESLVKVIARSFSVAGIDKDDVAQTARVPEHVLRAAEDKFCSVLDSVLGKCAQSKCDIFEAAQRLKRFRPKEYAALKDGLPGNIQPSYDIRFDTLR